MLLNLAKYGKYKTICFFMNVQIGLLIFPLNRKPFFNLQREPPNRAAVQTKF